jgi:hypothetical protein
VRANPGLAVICVSADAGLRNVVDASFCFAASETKAHSAQIKIFDRFRFGLASARTVAAWH